MVIRQSAFGFTPDGRQAMLYNLKARKGLEISVSNFGATITSIKTPDQFGQLAEITAGFSNVEDYTNPHPYFGATIGRYANRIANGRFTINGQPVVLTKNLGNHHIHGGFRGFNTKLWDTSLIVGGNYALLKMNTTSHDREEGYPGNLKVSITFTIWDNNKVEMVMEAETDKPTHINMTNHNYYNLSGFADDVFGHDLMINALKYLEMDDDNIPTGKIIPCSGGQFHCSAPTETPHNLKKVRSEMDHCFVVDNSAKNVQAAILYHKASGRSLQIFTNQPGMQVYTGNYLDGTLKGHKGISYERHSAICLESQHFPDSPNHAHFPQTLILPEQTYHHWQMLVFDNTRY